MVLDKVVVKDWRADVHYKIPLPKPASPPDRKVSTQFDLRSTCTEMYRDTFSLLWRLCQPKPQGLITKRVDRTPSILCRDQHRQTGRAIHFEPGQLGTPHPKSVRGRPTALSVRCRNEDHCGSHRPPGRRPHHPSSRQKRCGGSVSSSHKQPPPRDRLGPRQPIAIGVPCEGLMI